MRHATKSAIAAPLALATRLVIRRPRLTIFIALLLAAGSVALAVAQLDFHTSRLDLLNPDSHFNQRWLAYLDEFGRQDDAVVVVEGPGAAAITPALDQLAAELARHPDTFQAVLYRPQLSQFRAKGLYYLSAEQLDQVQRWLAALPADSGGQADSFSFAASDLVRQILTALPRSIGSEQSPSEASDEQLETLQVLLTSLQRGVGSEAPYLSPWPRETAPEVPADTGYMLSDNQQFGFLLLRFPATDSQSTSAGRAIDRLRGVLERVNQQHADVQIGVTGLPILENDEMRASQQDMGRASALSLLGVATLFIAGFGGLRHPVMTVGALLLAMAWSLGYITLSVGHLNLLSVSFGVILIGLGIDFGIHYVASYLQYRRARMETAEALEVTAREVGPGVLTGGVTTALAFLTAGLTKFTGVAELGVIAAGGILLCIASALLVLPALIQLFDGRSGAAPTPTPLPIAPLFHPLTRWPLTVFAITAVTTLVAASAASHLRYDHNLLNLQPERLESVELERRLLEGTDQSVWYALSMASDPNEVRRLKQKFEQLPTVGRVEQLAELFPEVSASRQQQIQAISNRLRELPARVEAPGRVADSRQDLQRRLSSLNQFLAVAPVPEELVETAGALQHALSADPELAMRRLRDYQHHLARDLQHRLRTLRDVSTAEPPQVSDLPPELAVRFVGRRQRHLLRVYAKENVWSMDGLRQFVREVESVDPQITGHPVQTFYASRQMQQSYIHAAVYALLAVAIVLMLDFHSIRDTLLAMLPVSLGTLQMCGLLAVLDIPLNPANMIALPLILGIGIDDGVHVVHDYRRQRGVYMLGGSTAMAVLLTSATTMVGFGSLMLARHQGLRSLGQVLTIGVFCCLLSSVVVLPALLAWLTRHRIDRPVRQQDVAPLHERPPGRRRSP